MKLMIASDIHGSAYYCLEMLDAMKKECPDRLLLLGDILYHGPRNDLPLEYEPKKVIKMLNEVKEKLFCVRGNCDTEVDQMVLDFPIMADYAVIPCGNRIIYATHGHHHNVMTPIPMQPGDILLHGHTHVPAWESIRKREPLLKSRLRFHPKRKQRPQLHDPGRRSRQMEKPIRRSLPRTYAVEKSTILRKSRTEKLSQMETYNT